MINLYEVYKTGTLSSYLANIKCITNELFKTKSIYKKNGFIIFIILLFIFVKSFDQKALCISIHYLVYNHLLIDIFLYNFVFKEHVLFVVKMLKNFLTGC